MYTPIQLEKMRNIRYGYRGISIAEKALGMNINKILIKAAKEELTIEEIITLLWAGLVHEDKELTIDNVFDLADEYVDIEAMSNLIGEALSNTLAKPDKKESQGKNVQKVASKK